MNQKIIILIVLLLSNFFVNAQYGVLDNAFNPADLGLNSSNGVGGAVLNSVEQPDGKILIGGSFSSFNGIALNGLCRLTQTGTLDPTFTNAIETTYSATLKINRILLLPNGQMLIGGLFNSGSCVHLARLNSDGSLDPTFNNDTIFNGEVTNIGILQDGRIVVSGNFSQCYNQTRNGIAILNTDGTLDNTFVPNTPAGCTVKALCVTQDNKILISRPYSLGNPLIQKLELTGQIDASFSFNTGFGTSVNVNNIRELPSGKILVCGLLPVNTCNQNGLNGILRLNSNGSLDPNFHSYSSATPCSNREIHDFQVLNNGSIIIGGRGVNYYQLAKLDSLGVESADFQYQSYPSPTNSVIRSICLLSNSAVLVGGSFSIQNEYRNGLMKFTTDGTFVPEFMPYYGANKPVRRVQKMSNGQLMISGDFSIYNGHIVDQFARINAVDGSIDTSFHGTADDAFTLDVETFVVQSTGKIIAKYNNNSLRRYNPDGSLDPSFNIPISGTADFKMLVDNTDRIYYYANSSINRLLPDGSVDPSFIGSNVSGAKNFIILASGKLIFAGTFGVIRRLNEDGTLDNSFTMDPGLTLLSYNSYYGFQVYEDAQGKLVCGNSFQMNGFINYAPNMYFRLNTDGSFDTSFKPVYPVIDVVGTLSDTTTLALVQIPGLTYQHLVLLKDDGTIDYRFPKKEFQYANFRASSLMLSDERFILAGYIDSYDGQVKNNILAVTNCFGPVKYDHITAYNNYAWIDGVNYTESNIGQQVAFPTAGCDSIVILDLNIIHPEINLFTTPSSDSVCNGVAYVTMTGIGPFTFFFQGSSDIENTNHTYTDLCPGIYDISVTDALGFSYNSTFVIAVDSSYYFDPFAPGTIIDDSLSVTVENCDIDYNTVYDVYIDSFTEVGQDSIMVYWAVVDSSNTTIIETLYHFPDTVGNYYVQLELFCSVKSSGHFLVGTQGVRYQNGSLSTLKVSDNELKNLILYPNPTNDQVHINFSGSEAELTVYDLQGKVVLKDQIQNQGMVSLQNLERGVYLFDVKNSNGQTVKRVVKQ